MRGGLKSLVKATAKTPNVQLGLITPDVRNLVDRDEFLRQWIHQVSLARPELGGFAICPFAKTSNYKIIECSISSIMPEDGYDVILYVIDSDNLDEINYWVETYNQQFDSWLFFEDCASYDTFINGIKTNNGKYNLIIGQPKDKLRKFREVLKKTDYYSYWSKEYYDEIMSSDS